MSPRPRPPTQNYLIPYAAEGGITLRILGGRRSLWGLTGGPYVPSQVPLEKEARGEQREMGSQPGSPGAARSWKRQEGVSPRVSGGSTAVANTWMSDFRPPELREKKFLLWQALCSGSPQETDPGIFIFVLVSILGSPPAPRCPPAGLSAFSRVPCDLAFLGPPSRGWQACCTRGTCRSG